MEKADAATLTRPRISRCRQSFRQGCPRRRCQSAPRSERRRPRPEKQSLAPILGFLPMAQPSRAFRCRDLPVQKRPRNSSVVYHEPSLNNRRLELRVGIEVSTESRKLRFIHPLGLHVARSFPPTRFSRRSRHEEHVDQVPKPSRRADPSTNWWRRPLPPTKIRRSLREASPPFAGCSVPPAREARAEQIATPASPAMSAPCARRLWMSR